jgi:hypothetical protein
MSNPNLPSLSRATMIVSHARSSHRCILFSVSLPSSEDAASSIWVSDNFLLKLQGLAIWHRMGAEGTYKSKLRLSIRRTANTPKVDMSLVSFLPAVTSLVIVVVSTLFFFAMSAMAAVDRRLWPWFGRVRSNNCMCTDSTIHTRRWMQARAPALSSQSFDICDSAYIIFPSGLGRWTAA